MNKKLEFKPVTKLEIKQEPYFPFTFKIFGAILCFSSLFVMISTLPVILKGVAIAVVIGLGTVLISAYYGLIIDANSKTFTSYVWVLGFKVGQPVKFHSIEKCYVNHVEEVAKVTSRSGRSSKVSKWIFKAFLKLDSGEKVFLDSDKNKEDLYRRIEDYKKIIGVLFESEAS